MGFSIGRFIGSIAPFLGASVGGPLGAAVGLGVSSALAEPARPAGRALTPAQAPQVAVRPTSVVPTTNRLSFAALPSTTSIAGFSATPLLRGAAQIATGFGLSELFDSNGGGGGRSKISQILAQARQTFGAGVTKRKIIAAAKTCGIDVASATFGIDARDVCTVIIAGAGRRRRGVSAADIRRTRRTIRFVNSLRKDLKKIK